MTIQDLNPFLDKNLKLSRTREVPLLKFTGTPVAIDGHNLAYKNIAVANKTITSYTNVGAQEPDREAVLIKWYSLALDVITLFLSHGITPVFIFDGEHCAEKANTQDKRKQQKIKDREEIKRLQEELKQCSPLDRNPEKIKRLRQLLANSNYISRDEMKTLMDLLRGIGIPVLIATGEAEELCSSLARVGLVSAVYSTDTDNLALGCPLLITNLSDTYYVEEKNRSFRNASCVYLNEILDGIGLSQEEFLEFCILCGCDFNTRISKLGPATAYKLIKEYHSIDNLPDRYDITQLRHKRCREIFASQPPQAIDENKEKISVIAEDLIIQKDLLFTQGEEVLSEYSASPYMKRLWYLYQELQDAKGTKIELPKRRLIRIKAKKQDSEEVN